MIVVVTVSNVLLECNTNALHWPFTSSPIPMLYLMWGLFRRFNNTICSGGSSSGPVGDVANNNTVNTVYISHSDSEMPPDLIHQMRLPMLNFKSMVNVRILHLSAASTVSLSAASSAVTPFCQGEISAELALAACASLMVLSEPITFNIPMLITHVIIVIALSHTHICVQHLKDYNFGLKKFCTGLRPQ